MGALAQLVEQLTFNQLVAGSNPARPTSVKRRPKGAFLLCTEFKDSNLQQVRVSRSETTEPFTATARRASEASHPARPTSVKRRPKGAFLLSAIYKIRTYFPDGAALIRSTKLQIDTVPVGRIRRQSPSGIVQRNYCDFFTPIRYLV